LRQVNEAEQRKMLYHIGKKMEMHHAMQQLHMRFSKAGRRNMETQGIQTWTPQLRKGEPK